MKRAPQAIPALVAGLIAILLAIFLGPGLVFIATAASVVLGGMAWSETRSHGYDGAQIAIAGMALGLAAMAISVVVFLSA